MRKINKNPSIRVSDLQRQDNYICEIEQLSKSVYLPAQKKKKKSQQAN